MNLLLGNASQRGPFQRAYATAHTARAPADWPKLTLASAKETRMAPFGFRVSML
jgi:hypothetical protein